ncbi:hypothetical protein ApDm4_0368 [Acetobacter pomorum]|nr:hypothetical protein CPF11_04955 [Acetobacter pomorum]KGB26605.1 hypothetical protein ApDm4_0368 [Acetobacter pomorum]
MRENDYHLGLNFALYIGYSHQPSLKNAICPILPLILGMVGHKMGCALYIGASAFAQHQHKDHT